MKKIFILNFLILLISSHMNAQVIKGTLWSAKKVENTYVISINDKASIIDALTDFVKSQNIKSGQITGIGATNNATLRFFDPVTKKYVDKTFKEQMEIANLSGNISENNGSPLLHLHITLGRNDYTALAGHLLDANIRGAGEIYIYPLDSKIIKTKNENIGLNIYDFEK